MFNLSLRKNCKKIRTEFSEKILGDFETGTGWLGAHVSGCSRCRQRLARLGRVNLALTLLKTQPQNLLLLGRANTAALNTLRHSLRFAPAADKLRTARFEQGWFTRQTMRLQPVLNAAACLLFITLLKGGIFSAMKNFQETSDTAVKNHYARLFSQAGIDDTFEA